MIDLMSYLFLHIQARKNKSDSSSAGSDSDIARDDVIDAKKFSSKKKSGPQWVAQIERDNACTEHPGHACIKTLPIGHHQLTKSEMSTWAIFLASTFL